MAEQLSQNQIDDLLKRLTAGEPSTVDDTEKINGKVVKEYDFKSPKKFTKEQLKLLEDLYENYSRILSTYFSGLLHTYCEVNVLQIEEQRYFEFSNALPEIALIAMVDIKPYDKHFEELSVIMDVSTQLGYFMIDRMLGGSGEGYNLSRVFTDLELAILKNMFKQITLHMKNAWDNYVEVETELSGLETNARMLQSLAPNEIVVIIILNISVGDITGYINLCIPATGLGEIINSFNSKYQKSTKRKIPDVDDIKKSIYDNVINSDLEVKAVLHSFNLDVQSIMQLQVDDIIPLDKSIDSDICVTVDGVPWFDGRLGKVKQKKAIKLNHFIKKDKKSEQENSDGQR